MSGTTTVYGLPFPSAGDPSDGAGNMQSGFAATDTAVAGLFSRKTANQALATTNTTLQNVTNLVVTPAINSQYWVRMMFLYQSPAASAIKIAWATPVGWTIDWTSGALASSVTAATSGIIEKVAYTLASVPVLGVDGATTLIAMVDGYLVTNATAGNLQLQAAQSVSSASASTVMAGSVLWLRKTV